MKNILSSLIATACAAIAISANASVTPTNVVDFINVELEFTSITATNTEYATNIISHSTSKTHISVTNVVTNITYKSITTAIATSDVIAALTGNTAPKGSTLARVRETNGTSYIAVRHDGTNVLIPGATITLVNSLTVPLPKPAFKVQMTSTGTKVTGTAGELVNFDFTTPTLSLSAKGSGTRTWTGDSFNIGAITLQDLTETVAVAGTGTDSSGANELVTGTVKIGGDTLAN